MAKNDVVKKDLAVANAALDWDADVDPIDLPAVHGKRLPAAPMAKPPTDKMITGEELTQHPYCSVGKVQMKFGTRWFYGSGWVVSPRAFITAGHCVYWEEKGGWVSQVGFCPRFNLKCERAWTVSAVYTLQGWIDGDRTYDLAACVVTKPFTATEPPLAFAKFTLPPIGYATLGYPSTPTDKHDFNGKRMWRCQGEFVVFSGDVITAANDFTSGSSGGPWFEPPDGKAGGITSGRVLDDPNLAQSPIFGEGFQNLYNAVKDL